MENALVQNKVNLCSSSTFCPVFLVHFPNLQYASWISINTNCSTLRLCWACTTFFPFYFECCWFRLASVIRNSFALESHLLNSDRNCIFLRGFLVVCFFYTCYHIRLSVCCSVFECSRLPEKRTTTLIL